MKLPVILVLVLSGFGIASAQLDTSAGSSIDPWLKFGVAGLALGALIWVVQYLLRNTIPNQEKAFQETLDKIIERSEKHDEQFREGFAIHTQNCQQIQQRWLDQAQRKE